MPTRRSYASFNDGCAAAHALDMVGERWALIVVRELLLGPKRFNDLHRDVLGISATVLVQRLRDLERQGVIEQVTLPAPARVPVYRLTSWGQQLESVIAVLSSWGAQSADLPQEADMSPDSIILAMRAHARSRASVEAGRIELLLVDDRHAGDLPPQIYRASLGPTANPPEKGIHEAADVSIATGSRTWQRLVFRRLDIQSALDTGECSLAPDTAKSRKLVMALLETCNPLTREP